MKKLTFIAMIMNALLVNAKEIYDQHVEPGIIFEKSLSWHQIKEKAKAENKYIFIDCYATWCQPCKAMDREIYTVDSIGKYINSGFISVKIQMDTSIRDDGVIKKYYADAHQIMKEYKVMAYPNLLFFSPDGKLVHRGLGYHNVVDFLSLAKDARDPDKQYYTLLENYEHGDKDYKVMPYVAKIARTLGENSVALYIAEDYIHNYLDKMSDQEFCKKENLEFIDAYGALLSSRERIFDWYYNSANRIDSIVNEKGYSNRHINFIIYKEEISPKIETAKKNGIGPDWGKIVRIIKLKYKAIYAINNILRAKVGWYKFTDDWKNYSKYLVQMVERDIIDNTPSGVIGVLILNNEAWDIFQYSESKRELKKALLWIDRAIAITSKPLAGVIDTKANILYKLGKRKAAIDFEVKAVMFEPHDQDISARLEKMKNGLPTWPNKRDSQSKVGFNH